MNFNLDILSAKICPYCQSDTKIVDSQIVYGRSYGPVYVCKNYPECDSYVGCHSGKENKPLGRLANRELRAWKQEVHQVFDPLWKSGYFTSRTAAYEWLAEKIDISRKYCHIGMFDIPECKQVLKLIDDYMKSSEVKVYDLDRYFGG